MSDEAIKSPLHSRHVALEAQMAETGGWLMPLAYGGVLDELAEVRRRAGVWDVSHMGRLRISGDWALELLEHACTSDVAHQEDDTVPGRCCAPIAAGSSTCASLPGWRSRGCW